MLSGGEMIARALEDEGVEYIFGYPGGAVLHIYDALFKGCKVPHILVRHEQAATHAADGYARATGKPGVVLVTSGPGVTNAITGIATAYMDSIPMVIITGQVPVAAIGLDAFQECDTVGITRPIVKHNFLVKDAKDMAEVNGRYPALLRIAQYGEDRGHFDIAEDAYRLTIRAAQRASAPPRIEREAYTGLIKACEANQNTETLLQATQAAVDALSSPSSQSRWVAPSMVASSPIEAGPGLSWFGWSLRCWRVSSTWKSTRLPWRTLR